MPKKSKKSKKYSHPLAGYKGKARIGAGKKRKPLSEAQKLALAKGMAKLAAMRAAGTIPRRGSAKKVVKAVKRAEKKAEKDVKKTAKKAAKKGGKAPSKARVAKAAKKAVKHTPVMYGPHLPPGGVEGLQLMNQMVQREREATASRVAGNIHAGYKKLLKKRTAAVADQVMTKCAEDMKRIKQEAEHAFGAERKKYQKQLRALKKAHKQAAAVKKKAEKPHKTKTRPHKAKTKPHKAKTKPHKAKAQKPKNRPPMSIPGTKGSGRQYETGHRGEPVAMAADILKGGRARAKVKGKWMDFWTCAGPVRSGCGSTGHVVRGIKHKSEFPDLGNLTARLRPGSKEVVI